jgi:hypothetical protein
VRNEQRRDSHFFLNAGNSSERTSKEAQSTFNVDESGVQLILVNLENL